MTHPSHPQPPPPPHQSRLIAHPWATTAPCPRCGLAPVQHHAGLWHPERGWTTGRLWWSCPACGRRAPKASDHATAARHWNTLAQSL